MSQPLSTDDTNLGMVLPMRADMDLAEYMRLLTPEFFTAIPIAETVLCTKAGGAAVLLSTAPDDHGHLYRFEGCDPVTGDLIFTPAAKVSIGDDAYQRALVFIEQEKQLYMGLSTLNYRYQNRYQFTPPSMVYVRKTRANKRVTIEGHILLRRLDGRTVLARLNDFSPSGASFYTDESFASGEALLAEIEVLDCGVCETVVTTVRQENLHGGRPYRHLIGIKMQLTAAQRKKAEQLYLCKKAAG
jgi:hypothetical protein